MDTIFIHALQAKVKLGVPEWERRLPQTVQLDIELDYDLSAAVASGSLTDTIDYAVVVARIRQELEAGEFQLLELLANRVCQILLQEFGVNRAKVSITKPHVLAGVEKLGVTMERHQHTPSPS
ncbi:MAG: dihydroneopterin aldolase [Methylophilaceae bacterium]|nr:dihydroneopterin aldolase [Methylophilaceae bacterium]